MPKKKESEQSKPNLADIAEMMARPDEYQKDWSVLLKGGAKEGAAVLSRFWGQIAYFQRSDGNLGAIDNRGYHALSRDGGRTYEYLPQVKFVEPTVSAAVPQISVPGGTGGYNGPAGVVKMRSGKLGMTSSRSIQVGNNQDIVDFFFQTSGDDGATWSPPVLVNRGRDKGTPLYDTLVQLQSGRLIQPVRWCFWAGKKYRKMAVGRVNGKPTGIEGHAHHPELEVAYCYFSDDEGKTWSRSEGDIIGWLTDGWDNFGTCDEPALEQLPDGRLLMLIRTMLGRLFQSVSEDEGRTWSVPEPTGLASSHAPCALKRIPKTGDLLCVWNQESATEIRRGLRRNRLSAAVTRDGAEWKHFRTVEWHPCVEEAGRIAPEPKIQLCRALDDVGELPEDWGFSSYPTIGFHKDEVIISYSHGSGRDPEKTISKCKHRILPLSWFYEKS